MVKNIIIGLLLILSGFSIKSTYTLYNIKEKLETTIENGKLYNDRCEAYREGQSTGFSIGFYEGADWGQELTKRYYDTSYYAYDLGVRDGKKIAADSLVNVIDIRYTYVEPNSILMENEYRWPNWNIEDHSDKEGVDREMAIWIDGYDTAVDNIWYLYPNMDIEKLYGEDIYLYRTVFDYFNIYY